MLLVEAYAISKCPDTCFSTEKIFVQIVLELIQKDFRFRGAPFLVRGQLDEVDHLRSKPSHLVYAAFHQLDHLWSKAEILASNADARSSQPIRIKEFKIVVSAAIRVGSGCWIGRIRAGQCI